MAIRLSLLAPVLALTCLSLWGAEQPESKGKVPFSGRRFASTPENRDSPPPVDPSAKAAAPAAPRPAYVSVVKERPGRQTLVVRYLWKAHAQASIEIRLLPGEKAENVTVSPLYFLNEYFKGPVKEKINHCLDLAERGATDSFLKDNLEFRIIGGRNSLGCSAVTVLPFNPKTPGERKDADAWSRPTVVFPLLDSWAIDDRTLALDLPRDVSYKSENDKFARTFKAFSRPGKLYIWFLRGDKVLWEEQATWPGE